MAFVAYNSRDLRHKSVFGSSASGEKIWFCVLMPRDMGVSAVYLVTSKDGGENNWIRLDWKSTDGITEWWGVEYSFDESGLFFYHFEFDAPYGRGKIFLNSAGMGEFSDSGRRWQQTVYSPDFKTPDKFKGGVMYQIFPDRFYYSGKSKKNVPSDRKIHKSWSDGVKWRCGSDGKYRNDDYFCGDLNGIKEKLDYLKDMGVTCLYLNPIFEAHSNHRYNTADYMKIDPLLGTNPDFVSLCKDAEKHGISIILDGVFSHTGDDSIYFNKENRYDSVGAYNSQSSVYYPWYTFEHWNDKYKSWWGFTTLPETNETDENYCEFITGKNGVVRNWLRAGASGFRLDVADELPDSFIEKIRSALKAEKPDALLIGEVWEDASNKFSMGTRRRYLAGNELDSVMNYPFRDAVISFMLDSIAENFNEKILTVVENYPPQTLDVLMNSLGTHDTERIFSVLGGINAENRDREWQSTACLDEKQRESALRKLKCAAVLQFTLPGIPCVYYGDEIPLEGCKDPFNRAPFKWNENKLLYNTYKELAKIRREHESLARGKFVSISAMLGCVAYARECENDSVMVICNMNPHDINYYLPPERQSYTGLSGAEIINNSVAVRAESAVILSRKSGKGKKT